MSWNPTSRCVVCHFCSPYGFHATQQHWKIYFQYPDLLIRHRIVAYDLCASMLAFCLHTWAQLTYFHTAYILLAWIVACSQHQTTFTIVILKDHMKSEIIHEVIESTCCYFKLRSRTDSWPRKCHYFIFDKRKLRKPGFLLLANRKQGKHSSLTQPLECTPFSHATSRPNQTWGKHMCGNEHNECRLPTQFMMTMIWIYFSRPHISG